MAYIASEIKKIELTSCFCWRLILGVYATCLYS